RPLQDTVARRVPVFGLDPTRPRGARDVGSPGCVVRSAPPSRGAHGSVLVPVRTRGPVRPLADACSAFGLLRAEFPCNLPASWGDRAGAVVHTGPDREGSDIARGQTLRHCGTPVPSSTL